MHGSRDRSAVLTAAVLATLCLAAAGCSPADEGRGTRDVAGEPGAADGDGASDAVVLEGDGGACDPGTCDEACVSLGLGSGTCTPTGSCSCSGGAEDGGVDTAPGDDGGAPPDVTEPDVAREVPDYSWDAVCGVEDLPVEFAVSSDVLIVFDRSNSMTGTLPALKDAVNTIVGASEDRIWFGLMPFPSSVPPETCLFILPPTQCAVPSRPQVAPGPLGAAAVADALAGLGVCGGTPTAATLRRAHEYFRGAATGHTQYVLLVTDGVPNCNSSLDPATCVCTGDSGDCAGSADLCLDDAATYAALDDLLAAGIATYVVGLGRWSGTDRTLLDNMAVHGGTEHFYPAEDPAAILAVLEDVMSTIVVSCVFDLHPGADVDPTEVNLYIGGELVPRDPSHTDGWDYVDADTVEFFGPACERILAGEVSSVSATYGCPTVFL